jgi:hypothetical protein
VEKPNENLEGISGEKRVLIPRKALQELQQLLNATDADAVEFADDEHTLFFRVGHRTLSTRKLSGQFPNFEAVMPRDNTKFAVVRSSELSQAIQRVAQFADEHSGAIRLRLESNELKISSSSNESGESEDTIRSPWGSTPATFWTFLKLSITRARCAWNSRIRSPRARCARKIRTRSTSTAMCSCPCESEASEDRLGIESI